VGNRGDIEIFMVMTYGTYGDCYGFPLLLPVHGLGYRLKLTAPFEPHHRRLILLPLTRSGNAFMTGEMPPPSSYRMGRTILQLLLFALTVVKRVICCDNVCLSVRHTCESRLNRSRRFAYDRTMSNAKFHNPEL